MTTAKLKLFHLVFNRINLNLLKYIPLMSIKLFRYLYSFILVSAFFSIIWISATGKNLMQSPDPDLLFGIFFENIFIPFLLLLIAWFIISRKENPDRLGEYKFLNSIPVSASDICQYYLISDLLRFIWVPAGISVLNIGLISHVPISFIIRLNILTFLVYAVLFTGSVLSHLVLSLKVKRTGAFSYPVKFHPMIQFLVIICFAITQINWIIFPKLNTGYLFWFFVFFLISGFAFLVFLNIRVFKKWQFSNLSFRFENIEEKKLIFDYQKLSGLLKKNLPVFKPSPFLLKNLLKYSRGKNSTATVFLSLLVITFCYFAALNNERIEDSIAVLFVVFIIYSILFVIRSIIDTGNEIEPVQMIYSIPVSGTQFYASVFIPSLLWLMSVLSILTTLIFISGSGIFMAFMFWMKSVFAAIIILVIGMNAAFSNYPDTKLAQQHYAYYLLAMTMIMVIFFKYRIIIAIILVLISSVQLRKMKLYFQ